MNYTIRIKRQENPQASPCWQEFSFEGSADTSIASVLNELNHRSPLCEKSGTVVSPIAWECGCMIRKCGACAMRINGLPRLACSVFLFYSVSNPRYMLSESHHNPRRTL